MVLYINFLLLSKGLKQGYQLQYNNLTKTKYGLLFQRLYFHWLRAFSVISCILTLRRYWVAGVRFLLQSSPITKKLINYSCWNIEYCSISGDNIRDLLYFFTFCDVKLIILVKIMVEQCSLALYSKTKCIFFSNCSYM